MKINAYHNTESKNIKSIFENGFTSKYSQKHWLGQGIYFFSEFDTAINNIDMLQHEDEIKTIAVEINVENEQFLDLDTVENINEFRKYCQDKLIKMKELGTLLKIETTNKKEAMLIYKCFFIDLYKMEKNYQVISRTFPKENPPYANEIQGISYLGLPFFEKYICVTDNKYIVKKNLVEKEWVL